MDVRIRGYEASDLDACRRLWVELTDWHRRLYDSPGIGGDEPWRKFDEQLEQAGAENIWIADAGGPIRLTGLVPAAWRGRGVGTLLARAVLEAAQARGDRYLQTRPVARNDAALQFFHGLGFDALGQLELIADLRPRDEQQWRPGASLAGRTFRV